LTEFSKVIDFRTDENETFDNLSINHGKSIDEVGIHDKENTKKVFLEDFFYPTLLTQVGRWYIP
jgi:hypothetical protein